MAFTQSNLQTLLDHALGYLYLEYQVDQGNIDSLQGVGHLVPDIDAFLKRGMAIVGQLLLSIQPQRPAHSAAPLPSLIPASASAPQDVKMPAEEEDRVVSRVRFYLDQAQAMPAPSLPVSEHYQAQYYRHQAIRIMLIFGAKQWPDLSGSVALYIQSLQSQHRYKEAADLSFRYAKVSPSKESKAVYQKAEQSYRQHYGSSGQGPMSLVRSFCCIQSLFYEQLIGRCVAYADAVAQSGNPARHQTALDQISLLTKEVVMRLHALMDQLAPKEYHANSGHLIQRSLHETTPIETPHAHQFHTDNKQACQVIKKLAGDSKHNRLLFVKYNADSHANIGSRFFVGNQVNTRLHSDTVNFIQSVAALLNSLGGDYVGLLVQSAGRMSEPCSRNPEEHPISSSNYMH